MNPSGGATGRGECQPSASSTSPPRAATWHQRMPSSSLPCASTTESSTSISTRFSVSCRPRSEEWALRSPARQAWTCRGPARPPPTGLPSAAQERQAAGQPGQERRTRSSAPRCAAGPVCVWPGGLPKQGGRDPSQAPLPRQSSARSTRRLRSSVSVGRRAGPWSSYRLSGEVLTPGPSLTTAAHAAKQQSSQLPPLRGCRSACSRSCPLESIPPQVTQIKGTLGDRRLWLLCCCVVVCWWRG